MAIRASEVTTIWRYTNVYIISILLLAGADGAATIVWYRPFFVSSRRSGNNI